LNEPFEIVSLNKNTGNLEFWSCSKCLKFIFKALFESCKCDENKILIWTSETCMLFIKSYTAYGLIDICLKNDMVRKHSGITIPLNLLS
jgi:hypothetical protein